MPVETINITTDHNQTGQHNRHGTAHLDGEFVSLRAYDRLADNLQAEQGECLGA
ncbi:hypothetical protein [Haloquadratum walsbyi]|jgi:hypothetical protein|uniref:Uncharacterized protein n=1 Tax=Haloquadratum walsbyi J07HQW2 TaxID=1238425 RepID=U1PLN9_9EURY|nr:hypothetical protein [Haloquadratum walsbyi]ERG94622.1 MAG: hypothetical protein J07HQW2_01058 [Haloquadratum walsbyi J07HQW2]